MKHYSLRRRLFSLTVPIFIEILLIMLLGAVDVIMLSRLSDQSVAAVGVVNQLLNMVFLLFGVSTAGTSVLCAQYLGAEQHRNVQQVVALSVLFNLLVGVVVSVFLHAGARGVLQTMELRPALIADGELYMRIVGGSAFLQALSLTFSAVLRSANLAYYPMQVTLLINGVNMLANYALIFGKFGCPALGVEGAALATAFSRGLATLLLALVLTRKGFGFSWARLRPFPLDKLRNLLRIGLPSAGEQLSYSLSQVVITYFINQLGDAALATRTYAMNIIMFTFLFAMAIGQSGAICVGHLVGGRRRDAAASLGCYCIRAALLVSFLLAFVSALCGRTVFSLLTSNPEIIQLGVLVLMVDVVLELGRAVNILCCFMLRAAGDVFYPFLVGVIFMWGVATAFSYVFGLTLGFGLVGMWVAFTLDEAIRAVLLGRRWRSGKWANKDFVSPERR